MRTALASNEKPRLPGTGNGGLVQGGALPRSKIQTGERQKWDYGKRTIVRRLQGPPALCFSHLMHPRPTVSERVISKQRFSTEPSVPVSGRVRLAAAPSGGWQ